LTGKVKNRTLECPPKDEHWTLHLSVTVPSANTLINQLQSLAYLQPTIAIAARLICT